MFRATAESPRMFESDILDFFSRTHWTVVPLLYGPAILAMSWWSVAEQQVSVALTVGLTVGGFLTWTLAEYWLHRTFFHWQPPGKLGERLHFLVHGVHHKWPKDRYRLVMPPAVSLTLFFTFLGLWVLLLGGLAWSFHAGFVAGYVYYDVTHYYIHHYTPRSGYGRTLKKHHMLHHFKYHDTRFGVSMKLWDYVFGTVPPLPTRSTADRPQGSVS